MSADVRSGRIYHGVPAVRSDGAVNSHSTFCLDAYDWQLIRSTYRQLRRFDLEPCDARGMIHRLLILGIRSHIWADR